MRERYGFSEYAFHELAKELRVSWLAEHLDAVLAQTLASRAYRALNRVCVGKARRVRFKSRGRGLSSLENKRNDTGMRFVLQTQDQGRGPGYLLWHDDQLAALIDWDDPLVSHGLAHEIKYVRLIRRRACSPRAQGADRQGERYFVHCAVVLYSSLLSWFSTTEVKVVKAPPYLIPKGKGEMSMVGKAQ